MEYGLLTYDVPVGERNLYNRLRKKVRKISIPLNWSAYLIPWGLRDTVLQILKELQGPSHIIQSGVYKFDASEEKHLAAMAERGLREILNRAHQTLMTRLSKAEQEFSEISEKIAQTMKAKGEDDNLRRMKDIAAEQFEGAVKKALDAAEKALKEATGLATLFALSNVMEFAIEGQLKLIEEKRELYKARDMASVTASTS
jgi:ElaB/YqjD/DUF883 family membrane-anchored ribosome-binding protein